MLHRIYEICMQILRLLWNRSNSKLKKKIKIYKNNNRGNVQVLNGPHRSIGSSSKICSVVKNMLIFESVMFHIFRFSFGQYRKKHSSTWE